MHNEVAARLKKKHKIHKFTIKNCIVRINNYKTSQMSRGIFNPISEENIITFPDIAAK